MPSLLLMENAGRRVSDVVAGELRTNAGSGVTIVCGQGNNGGDGFVAARHLLSAGWEVTVHLVGTPSKLKRDPLVNFRVLKNLMKEPEVASRLRIVTDPSGRKFADARRPAVVVDALFGTGFHGSLAGGGLRAAEWINSQKSVIVAVDVPSGLDADNGRIGTGCVSADITITLGLLKAGLLTGMGPAVCGQVVVAGLGVPLRTAGNPGASTYRVTMPDAVHALPPRPFNAHKHSVGKVLVLAGSVGLTGAAALCAQAAMRVGAGAVILATPDQAYPVLARKLTEVMVKPLPDAPGGTFAEGSFAALGTDLDWADVIIAGPGIGRGPEVGGFIEKLLNLRGKRFLFDADLLSHLAGKPRLTGILRRNTCIVTPHTGEFSRMSGLDAETVEMDRVEAARTFAKEHRVTLVLKGAPTVTATPEGTVFINSTGNPGMASAGMGDVLAGMIGGIWAGTKQAAPAAWGGVLIHGAAGDRVAARLGERALMAGDVLSEIHELIDQK